MWSETYKILEFEDKSADFRESLSQLTENRGAEDYQADWNRSCSFSHCYVPAIDSQPLNFSHFITLSLWKVERDIMKLLGTATKSLRRTRQDQGQDRQCIFKI